MKEAMPSFRRCKAKFKYKIIQKEKQIGEFLGMKVIILNSDKGEFVNFEREGYQSPIYCLHFSLI